MARGRWCDVDWGFGAEVGDKRPGHYVCAGDTVAAVPNAPVLPNLASIF